MDERVPRFDGTPELLPGYKEKVIQYMMGIEWHKRYLVGPRLLRELSGVAQSITRPATIRNPQWLSHPRGGYTLLEFLEENLARPSLIDASHHIMKFVYNMGRQKGESMTEWSSRYSEALWEASTALRRVQREHGGQTQTKTKKTIEQDPWRNWSAGSNRASQRSSTQSGPFRDDGRLTEEDGPPSETGEHEQEGMWHQASWAGSWDGSQDQWAASSWYSTEYEPPTTWDFSEDIFIPEFLAGFLLLHRSGLEPNEKSNILAAIKGEFSTAAVSKALREQWSDSDLAKRDKQKGQSACFADEDDHDEDEALLGEEDAFYSEDPDIQEAYACEQEKIDHALEAIKIHKATLKEARWNQKQMRLGRNYYPPKPFSKGAGKGSRQKGQIQCFRCGGPHMQAQCPHRKSEAKVAEEAAEIVFVATECTPPAALGAQFAGAAVEAAQVASSVMHQCMGIIDSGATASLGSIDAMEALALQNIEQGGDSKIQLDLNKRPTFKFGNGMLKECVSTAQVQMQAGSKNGNMEIHIHDSPQQPVLVSRKALRSLGAVIDFESNQVIYKNADKKTVVPLVEAPNGHLLMPLAGNLLQGGVSRQTEFLNLVAE